MKFIDKNTIKLDKELNELDIFVLNFINIIEKYVDYIIISGYISLLFGRARGTEDVDILIKEIQKEEFLKLYKEIKKRYWCLNEDNPNEIYDYLNNSTPIRIAIKKQTIPNFEIKFAKTFLEKNAFQDKITVKTKKGNLIISSLERQIAYKKYYLKSEKDLEDAKHIEKVFKERIDYKKIENCKNLLENAKTKNK